MENYVFISYCTKDFEVVKTIENYIAASEIKYWMAPDSIPLGENYACAIPEAIVGCSCFLLILSRNSQDSIWVDGEISRARFANKPIIVIDLDNFTLNEHYKSMLENAKFYKVENISNYDKDLVDAIKEIADHTCSHSNPSIIDDIVQLQRMGETFNDSIGVSFVSSFIFTLFLSYAAISGSWPCWNWLNPVLIYLGLVSQYLGTIIGLFMFGFKSRKNPTNQVIIASIIIDILFVTMYVLLGHPFMGMMIWQTILFFILHVAIYVFMMLKEKKMNSLHISIIGIINALNIILLIVLK